MTYSKDLRQKALDYIEKGVSKEETSQIFGITIRTLFNWIKRKKTGCLTPSKRKERKPHKVDMEKLKMYVEENPDAYLREIAKFLGASVTAVFYACRRQKINLKKRHLSIANVIRKKEKIFKKSYTLFQKKKECILMRVKSMSTCKEHMREQFEAKKYMDLFVGIDMALLTKCKI